MGLVTQVYNEETIQNLKGHIAIGHNRYSTCEGSHIKHAQPIVINNAVALAHNGNLPSVSKLKEFLEGKDISTDDCSDSANLWPKLWVIIWNTDISLKKR